MEETRSLEFIIRIIRHILHAVYFNLKYCSGLWLTKLEVFFSGVS